MGGFKSFLVLASAMLSMAGAQAGPVSTTPTLDGRWYAVFMDTAESGTSAWFDIEGDHADTVSFDFTTTQAVWLTVVDAGFTGDTFQVLDGNVVLGTTSVPGAANYPGLTFDFDEAWADGNFSRGTYLLQAGTHHITGWLAQSALDDGGVPINATFAGLKLEVAAVPEPSSWLLALSGLAFVASLARRRFNA